MAKIVTGEMYEEIDGQLHEIKRQLRQKSGYPYNPEELKKALQAAVEGKFGIKKTEFPVWKTVNLGTHKDANALCNEIERECYCSKINNKTREILSRVGLVHNLRREKEVDLVLVSVAELGLANRASYWDIYSRAEKFGLECCLIEIAPQLRRQYENQPIIRDECLYVATEPINDTPYGFCTLVVGTGNGHLWLDVIAGGPGSFWQGSDQFIFTKPRK